MIFHYKLRRIRKIHGYIEKANCFNRILQSTILLPITLIGITLHIILELLKIIVELLEHVTGDAWLRSYRAISMIIRYILTLGRDPEFRIRRINKRLKWHDDYVLRLIRIGKRKQEPDTKIPEEWK